MHSDKFKIWRNSLLIALLLTSCSGFEAVSPPKYPAGWPSSSITVPADSWANSTSLFSGGDPGTDKFQYTKSTNSSTTFGVSYDNAHDASRNVELINQQLGYLGYSFVAEPAPAKLASGTAVVEWMSADGKIKVMFQILHGKEKVLWIQQQH